MNMIACRARTTAMMRRRSNLFQIHPLFNQLITEETLWDKDRPYVFWASLHLPIPKDPANPIVAIYDVLEEFIVQLAEEDPHFVVFPYRLSNYKLIKDLPPQIETLDDLPDDINEWLDYFPQAKPWVSGDDTYTTLLIEISIPFPKLIKNLSTWMQDKRFSQWKAYLQLEQPISLGWLLFSTQTMDMELLKEAISNQIKNIPVGLCWKTISHGSQGAIPKEQQVKALHVLVDKLDVNMAKLAPHHSFIHQQASCQPQISSPCPDEIGTGNGCCAQHKRSTEC